MGDSRATHDFAAARRETVSAIPEYFNLFNSLMSPYMTDFSKVGAAQGSALAQDFRAALGRLGASSTGVGAVAGVLGNSLISNTAAQSRMNYLQLLMQNVMQAQGNALQAGQGGKKPGSLGQDMLMGAFGGGIQAASQWAGAKQKPGG